MASVGVCEIPQLTRHYSLSRLDHSTTDQTTLGYLLQWRRSLTNDERCTDVGYLITASLIKSRSGSFKIMPPRPLLVRSGQPLRMGHLIIDCISISEAPDPGDYCMPPNG